MSSEGISFDRYNSLSREVWNQNDIQSALKEAYELIKGVKGERDKKKKESPEYKKLDLIHQNFIKEYIDLENSIKKAVSDNKNISKEGRRNIMLELSDIVDLAQKNGIKEDKNIASLVGDMKRGTNTEKAKDETNKLNDLQNLNINDYTEYKARQALEYTNTIYSSKDEASTVNKLFTVKYDTIKDLDDRYEIRLFQEKLIKKYLGGEKGFNNEYVQGFNQIKGNYIIKISGFEDIINTTQNIIDINSLALANYIKSLGTKATPETLIEKFGEEKLKQLGEIWDGKNNDDPNYGIAKKELEKVGMKNIIDIIKMFSSTENFLNGVSGLEKNGKLGELAIKYLEKNKEAIIKKFSDYLKKTIDKDFPNKSPKEKEAILKSILGEFEGVKNSTDLTKIAEKIVQVEEKYKLKSISGKYVTMQVQELGKTNNRIDETNNDIEIAQVKVALSTAKKNNDLEGINRHTQRIRTLEGKRVDYRKREVQFATNTTILQRVDDKTISQIGMGKIKLEDFVQELRKSDKLFDDELKKYESIDHQIEKGAKRNLKEEGTAQSENNNTLTYSNGTTLEYTQTSSGYELKTQTGDIQISPEEFKIIEGNETAKENLVNFKNTLDEFNLTGLWDYRNALFKGLGNVYIGDFNERDNYLNKNELKLFLVSILQSIGINISASENISTVKKNLQSANLVGILGGTKDVNMLGNSTIENMFIQKFDPKRTGMLKQGKFEQALKSKV